jgi:hypothetical protein
VICSSSGCVTCSVRPRFRVPSDVLARIAKPSLKWVNRWNPGHLVMINGCLEYQICRVARSCVLRHGDGLCRRVNPSVSLMWTPASAFQDQRSGPSSVQQPDMARTAAAQAQNPRVRALCGAVPARFPLLPGGMWRGRAASVFPTSPLKEKEGEVGNTTALLRKRKGSRRKGGTGIWGNPGPPRHPESPVPRSPQTPPPDLPANGTPPHP